MEIYCDDCGKDFREIDGLLEPSCLCLILKEINKLRKSN